MNKLVSLALAAAGALSLMSVSASTASAGGHRDHYPVTYGRSAVYYYPVQPVHVAYRPVVTYRTYVTYQPAYVQTYYYQPVHVVRPVTYVSCRWRCH